MRAYIVAPCIVYGEGEGFGNRVSIQTKAVVKAAQATRKVYSVNQGNAVSPMVLCPCASKCLTEFVTDLAGMPRQRSVFSIRLSLEQHFERHRRRLQQEWFLPRISRIRSVERSLRCYGSSAI